MKAVIKNTISDDNAFIIISEGIPLIDKDVKGEIDISSAEQWEKELTIENSVIGNFQANSVKFNQPVVFRNSHFKNCSFIFTYFSKGLRIENCIFESRLDFQAGGHNLPGFPINIENNIFKGFVNFFDCWYNSDFILKENTFEKGANIKAITLHITFDVEPEIENNVGETAIEGELYE